MTCVSCKSGGGKWGRGILPLNVLKSEPDDKSVALGKEGTKAVLKACRHAQCTCPL